MAAHAAGDHPPDRQLVTFKDVSRRIFRVFRHQDDFSTANAQTLGQLQNLAELLNVHRVAWVGWGKLVLQRGRISAGNQIIDHLYKTLPHSMRIYAAYFEFALYTGMRPSEIAALRWEEVDKEKRLVNVCRIVADYKIEERTKTRNVRQVMLNSRALHALEQAELEAQQRALQSRRKRAESPYVFPPTKNFEFIQQSSVTDKHFQAALTELGIRARRQYNCRHTYATMCLMAGMNPAFIATQLGHSVQMLLSTYARWINSSTDWSELGKLENSLTVTRKICPH